MVQAGLDGPGVSLRLLSWNILQGGGRRTDGIIAYLRETWPDIVTLQEFRAGPSGDAIRAALRAMGLASQWVAEPPAPRDNTILIAARSEFDAGDFMPDRTGVCHLVEAALEAPALTLLAAHFPQKAAQLPLFAALAEDSPSLLAAPAMLIGDLNCGIPYEDSDRKTFTNAAEFRRLLDLGWIDAFRSRNARAREFTWASPRTGNRFRYDHCLASPAADTGIDNVSYDEAPRAAGLSDHSALWVTLRARGGSSWQ